MKIVVKGGFRQIRMKRGFSIKSFAKEAGIAYRTAFRAETGESVYPTTAGKICATLKCEFDEIFNIIQ